MVSNGKIIIKTPLEIKIMAEGGRKLREVKEALKKRVREGVSAYDIDKLAETLIRRMGGEPSFKMVPGYKWATCVNVNEGVVHGIPTNKVIFKKGDVVSVDVGMFYKGFHTDTSFTIGIKVEERIAKFIKTGERALKEAISMAKVGNRIFDISKAIESCLRSEGYSPIKALVGHGVGRNLHEAPEVYCFTKGNRKESPVIKEGLVLAIEVMYTMGGSDVKVSDDGWTISSSDGTISGLFEETVAVTDKGPLVLT